MVIILYDMGIVNMKSLLVFQIFYLGNKINKVIQSPDKGCSTLSGE